MSGDRAREEPGQVVSRAFAEFEPGQVPRDPASRRVFGLVKRAFAEFEPGQVMVQRAFAERRRPQKAGEAAPPAAAPRAGAAQPAAAAEARGPIILWCGRFWRACGYRTVSLNHSLGLIERGGRRIALFDLEVMEFVGPDVRSFLRVKKSKNGTEIIPRNRNDCMVAIFNERPDLFNRITGDGLVRIIGYSLFEAGVLPAGWSNSLASLDEVWVVSEFNRSTFAKHGVPPFMMKKIPLSIKTSLYKKNIGEIRPGGGKKKKIVFLTVCTNMARRDLPLAIRAFVRAFSEEDPVLYVIKLSGEAGKPDALRHVLSIIKESQPADMNRFHVITRHLSDEDMVRLFRGCDVYVSVERANGWDLPTMEAMACGKLAIGFHLGGSTEYCDENVAVRLSVLDEKTTMQSTSSYNSFYTGQWWNAVDENLLVEALKRAKDRKLRSELGAAAQFRIETEYDQRRVAKNIHDRISSYEMTDYRSNRHAKVKIGTPDHPVWRTPAGVNANMADDLFAGMLSKPSGVLAAHRFVRSFKSDDLRRVVGSGTTGPVTRAVVDMVRVPWTQALRKVSALARVGAQAWKKRRTINRQGAEVSQGLQQIFTARYNPSRMPTESEIEARKKAFSAYPYIPLLHSERSKLGSLRNRYRGKRCFIMGNGPSLNRIDLSKLAEEYTFGVNKLYLLYDRIDWRPSFYTLLDWRMGPAVAPHVKKLSDSLKFIPTRFRGLFPEDDSTYWYTTRPVLDNLHDKFCTDMTEGIPSKGTILTTAIQIAFSLGFHDIYLIGADATYTIPDTVIQTGPDKFGTGVKLYLESTKDDDANHFDPSYFGKGAKWHDPNVEEMIRQFGQMRKGAEFNGARIRNATPGGKLEVFERVEFDSLFPPSRA